MSDSEDTPEQAVTAKTFKCGSCAAQMEFKPGVQAQVCPYCGFENPIPQSEEDIRELDFLSYLRDHADQEESDESMTVICQECGAETTVDPEVVAEDCPFCGSPQVSTAQSGKKIKPKSLLPFQVTRDEAAAAFRKWITGLWFAPNCLKKMAQQDRRINGMYVPYWTYDSRTTSFYRGERGEHYWETQHYTTTENGKTVHKTRQVRKTRWYPASGTVWASFDDVLVLASNSLPRKYTEKLEPWDLPNLVPYQDEYLSGFRAESYHIDLPQGFEIAQGVMDAHIRVLVCRDIGGDEQRIHSVKTQHDNVTFKHILLPVWISAYRYQNQAYRFLVNARTGEVQGERPYSWLKITLLVLAILAAVGVVFLMVQSSGGVHRF